MRLSVLELPARFAEPAQVLSETRSLLARAATDLALLPECALTGYCSPAGDFDLSAFAEPLDGPLVTGLGKLATEFACHLVAPFVERAGEQCFNSVALLSPTGSLLGHYRKRHPWLPERWASPGNLDYPSWEIHGLQIGLAICFDVHFIAEEMPEALAAADLLLFPSAWVDDDELEDSRTVLLTQLARRFDLVIANANWAPGDVRLAGQGTSRIVWPDAPPSVLPRLTPSVPQRLDAVVSPRGSAS